MRTRVLTVLHAVVALNAVGGGVYGLTGAAGVPADWLERTPFTSYLIPSVILLVVVGGSQAAAGLSVAARTPRARHVSLAAGAILIGWIGTQVALIGYVSWLQPAVALAALANLTLAWRLHVDGRALALLMLVPVLATCASPTELEFERILTLQVAPSLVACSQWYGPSECLQVRTDSSEEWRPLHDGIVGFRHEVGFAYELRVVEFSVHDPPADGSSRELRLARILKRVQVPPA